MVGASDQDLWEALPGKMKSWRIKGGCTVLSTQAGVGFHKRRTETKFEKSKSQKVEKFSTFWIFLHFSDFFGFSTFRVFWHFSDFLGFSTF